MVRLIDADALKKRLIEKRREIEEARRYGWEFASNGINAAIFLTGCEAAKRSIDAEPHWIPCSERMPNDDKDYLVTDGESMAVGYYRTDAKAWDNVNFGWLEHREETCGLKTVVAWMPLPEPYEGDKE